MAALKVYTPGTPNRVVSPNFKPWTQTTVFSPAQTNASRSQMNVGNGPVYLNDGYKPPQVSPGATSTVGGSYKSLVPGTGTADFNPPVFNTFPYTTNSMNALFGGGSGSDISYSGLFRGNGRDRRREPRTRVVVIPRKPSGPSWTEQLMGQVAQNQHYGGGQAKTVRQQGMEGQLVKLGYSKMPNPATLDPNDERLKFSKAYGYGSGGDIINMWDPMKTWVPGIAGGSLRGPPIRQY